jgi:hypothetical protein
MEVAADVEEKGSIRVMEAMKRKLGQGTTDVV